MTAAASPPLSDRRAALGQAVEDRILDLVMDRRWYRSQRNRAHWADLERDSARELMALLRLRRGAGRR